MAHLQQSTVDKLVTDHQKSLRKKGGSGSVSSRHPSLSDRQSDPTHSSLNNHVHNNQKVSFFPLPSFLSADAFSCVGAVGRDAEHDDAT